MEPAAERRLHFADQESDSDIVHHEAVRGRGFEVMKKRRACGVGFRAEHAERLFSSFFTTKSSGMGIGLSICRSIINAHGGRIWATANVPHGATFQFTLPAHPRS